MREREAAGADTGAPGQQMEKIAKEFLKNAEEIDGGCACRGWGAWQMEEMGLKRAGARVPRVNEVVVRYLQIK